MAKLSSATQRVRECARGECVLVHGEAGIGRTALLLALVQRLDPAHTRLIAGCDALYNQGNHRILKVDQGAAVTARAGGKKTR